MPVALLFGIALLVCVILLSRWYVNAEPKDLARLFKWASFILLVALVLFLAFTGRLSWALAAMTGLATWIARFMRIRWLYRMMQGAVGSNNWGGGPPPPTGQTSEVATRFVRMTLDHDSGAMTGEVVEGAFIGRDLDSLSRDEAHALWVECQADDESLRVLESWLDRTFEDWHETAPSGDSVMTEAEALDVLGLEPGATQAEIKSAYKRLMAKIHPDTGGSTYLASKINQAKDFLINR